MLTSITLRTLNAALRAVDAAHVALSAHGIPESERATLDAIEDQLERWLLVVVRRAQVRP